MHWRGISWILGRIVNGQFGFVVGEFWSRAYRVPWDIAFRRHLKRTCPKPHMLNGKVRLETNNPVAFESPDHQAPWGTKYDNNTNRKFVLHMAGLVSKAKPNETYASLDLGCSGGQLVKDFRDLGWLAVGLEGSDYSLKNQRANWPVLGGKSLFTCDISKPFKLSVEGKPIQFDLITAWEVIEHLRPEDQKTLFANIDSHLKPGGYFVGSTTSSPDVHQGIDLHQSKFSNQEWQKKIAELCPTWRFIQLGLKYYQYVRFHYYERSFLAYRKQA
jgi:2-polyprenyl-3-methyl-5-hydroxy-6-metoxy-1,4-benzoquinol methylase